MESGEIHDDQITASSRSSVFFGPALARLNENKKG